MHKIATISDLTNVKELGYEVIKLGHPVLRNPCTDILPGMLSTSDLQNFIENMRHTLCKEDGVGLAAPQVGVNIRLIVTQISEFVASLYLFCKRSDFKVWINPTVQILNHEELFGVEGCLSVPEYVGIVA